MKTKKLFLVVLLAFLLLALFSGCKKSPQHVKVTKGDGGNVEVKTCEKIGHSFEDGACIRCQATFSDTLEFELSKDGSFYILTGAKACKDEKVIIPAEYNGLPVTVIGESAFYYSLTAKTIIVPSTVETIESGAFHRCKMLTNIVFEEGSELRSIGDDAFLFCDSLLYIYLPEKLEYIGGEAFRGCYLLKDITLPDNIMYIGADVFTGTEYYRKSNNWENGILYIGKYLISANPSFSGKCVVKDGVRLLADESFGVCLYLISVELPSSIEVIGEGAFSNCFELERVSIPKGNNLKHIYKNAFSGCEKFLTINYGNTMSEWEDIVKEDGWDYYMGNHIVVCSDGNIY